MRGGTPPDRTLEQRMRSLELANSVRSAKARVRRRLGNGELHPGHLLTDASYARASLDNSELDIYLRTPIVDVLLWSRGIGRVKAPVVLRKAEIAPTRKIGRLKLDERARLEGELRRHSIWTSWDRIEREAA